MNPYIVIEVSDCYPLEIESTDCFKDAQDVGIFLWGKYIGKYLIYKNGILAKSAHVCGSVQELSDYLERL